MIEAYLKEEKEKFLQLQREPKLLLLGSSDSGKSTLLKQLKIKHGNGFTEEEKQIARQEIRRNLCNDVSLLMDKFLEGEIRQVFG
jgi:polynucleotide 5'-kinase involved in rRNA processing